MKHALLVVWAIACLLGCAEGPRATPGFQPLTPDPETGPPIEGNMPEAASRRASAATVGRVQYYGRAIDQYGDAVADALVFVGVERLSRAGSKSWHVYTRTDADGRFSVVGGRGTGWGYNLIKPGYTPYGRSGTLRADNGALCLSTPPEQPETVLVWKNSGFDRRQLIDWSDKTFRYAWPAPMSLRIDLVRGVVVTGDEPWDIEVHFSFTLRPGATDLASTDSYEYKDRSYSIRVNKGLMAYRVDPIPGLAREFNDMASRQGGVVVSALRSEVLTKVQYTGLNGYFWFRSRGGAVHGCVQVAIAGEPGTECRVSVSGYVNPTGSPALIESEPTAKDLSTEGWTKSE
jgi:hypothetical protein